jgi:hypothetical protein
MECNQLGFVRNCIQERGQVAVSNERLWVVLNDTPIDLTRDRASLAGWAWNKNELTRKSRTNLSNRAHPHPPLSAKIAEMDLS